jgi:hypothetical protein
MWSRVYRAAIPRTPPIQTGTGSEYPVASNADGPFPARRFDRGRCEDVAEPARRRRGRLTLVPDRPDARQAGTAPDAEQVSAEELLTRTARGDEGAFCSLYDLVCTRVFGLVRRVVRDPAHAEEVTQEVFLQVWRQAGRFVRAHGTALAWVRTLAHRRAVDRVRSAQAAADRDVRAAQRDVVPPHDQVAESSLRVSFSQSISYSHVLMPASFCHSAPDPASVLCVGSTVSSPAALSLRQQHCLFVSSTASSISSRPRTS